MLPLLGPPGQRVSVPMIGFAYKGRSSRNEFPSRCAIVIWICRRGVHLIRWFDAGDVPSSWGMRSASGLLPHGGVLMLGGLALGLAATWMEVQRKAKAAERLAQAL